ncbi:MAG: glycosyltransferase family 9 protein [Alphaproteobacteria bacterium]
MNILFITNSRIGDVVLSTGILEYIKNFYKDAFVTIVSDPLTVCLFKDYPLKKRIICLSKKPFSMHWVLLWSKVFKYSWNIVIDLRGSPISYFLKVKKRYVWSSIKPEKDKHKVEQISSLMKTKQPLPPKLWISDRWKRRLDLLMPSLSCSYLTIAPIANWIGKQWPLEFYNILLGRFLSTFKDAFVMTIAAPHEKCFLDQVYKDLPKERFINSFDDSFSLLDKAYFIKQSKLFVGNDSGLMHIAVAVGTRVIGLFGPSDENIYGPFDETKNYHKVLRIPLSYKELTKTPGFSHKSKDCYMKTLDVDKVWETLSSAWQSDK